jgi:transporter family-2 protein
MAPMTMLVLIAIFIGALLPVQTGINAGLRTFLGNPLATALVSFAVGALGLLAAVLALRLPLPLAAAWSHSSWWQWSGGLLGAIYIAGAVVLAPRLGAATMIAAVVGGQMVASLLLDQFGLVGFPQHSLSAMRVIGAALVILGVMFIQR